MDQLVPYPTTNELRMRDIVGILWRRKWTFLAVFITITALGATYANFRRPRYEATAQMIVTPRGAALGSSTDTSVSGQSGMTMESPETQIGMILSDGMAKRTLDQLKNDALAAGKPQSSLGVSSLEQFRLDFGQMVKVVNPLDTNLLQVTVTQPNPDRAATWANAICQAFIQWKKDLALQTVQDIAANLRKRANGARNQMVDAERKVTAYKQQHHLVDATAQQKSALEQYVARDMEAQTAQQDLIAQEARLKEIQSQLAQINKAIGAGTEVRDDQLVSKLQSDLSDLEAKRAEAATKYTPEYPGVLPELDKQIDFAKEKLKTAVQGTLDNKRPSLASQGALFDAYKQQQVLVAFDQARTAAAVRERDALKTGLAGLPSTELEYTRLQRNADLASQLYSQLELSLNNVLLNVDTTAGNVQVTQAAYPPVVPSGLPKIMLLIVVVVLALVLATGAALLAERGDHRLRSVERVRALIGGPVIGALSPVSLVQRRRLERGAAPPEVVEAYSLARANLALALRGAGATDPFQQQVILITSALPGEGKSVTAAELARSMARSGKKVILVDADMRRPSQVRLFNADPGLGLADVLSGVTTLEAALGAPVQDNLTVLQSGNVTRNPTEMISQPQMVQILARMRELADVVIVDAPACALVADALLIAPHVDCILQVISLGQANEELIRDTTIALQAAVPKALVFFINRAPHERSRRYRSYYHHHNVPTLNGNGRYEGNGTHTAIAALPGGPEQENNSNQDMGSRK